jgi:hypothetical protein
LRVPLRFLIMSDHQPELTADVSSKLDRLVVRVEADRAGVRAAVGAAVGVEAAAALVRSLHELRRAVAEPPGRSR